MYVYNTTNRTTKHSHLQQSRLIMVRIQADIG